MVIIQHANVTGNRGYGVYVNTTRGYVSLENSHVTNNFGDGIKYHFHDQVHYSNFFVSIFLDFELDAGVLTFNFPAPDFTFINFYPKK